MDRLEIEAFPPAGPDKGWIACLARLELCLAHLLHDGVLVIHPFPSIPRTGIRFERNGKYLAQLNRDPSVIRFPRESGIIQPFGNLPDVLRPPPKSGCAGTVRRFGGLTVPTGMMLQAVGSPFVNPQYTQSPSGKTTRKIGPNGERRSVIVVAVLALGSPLAAFATIGTGAPLDKSVATHTGDKLELHFILSDVQPPPYTRKWPQLAFFAPPRSAIIHLRFRNHHHAHKK